MGKIFLFLFISFIVIVVLVQLNPPEEIDYSRRVRIHIGRSENIAGNTYITNIAVTNLHDYSLGDITLKFIIGTPGGQPMAMITRDILPPSYELPPNATYNYELITKDYWYVDQVIVIYAN